VAVAAPPVREAQTASVDGVFETPAEVDALITDVEGQVPAGLVGALYRVGPGKLDLADHLFDGDGMVSAVHFGPAGEIRFRNRFVRTDKYLAELHATRPKVAGFGTRAAGGVLGNALRRPTTKNNAANTALLPLNGRLLALWEAGHPWQLDPDSLETIGEMDFNGALEARLPFSAHPHRDPATGEVFNFGMVYGPRNSVATYRIDAQGRLHHVAETRVPAPVLNHDFIITDRWLVFCLGPARVHLLPLLSGLASFGDSIHFHRDQATTVVLVPRDGGSATYIDAEPWFQYHFAGAFDDGDDIVVDLVRYPDYESINAPLKDFRHITAYQPEERLWRYRISPTRRSVEGHEVAPLSIEFPQVDPRRATGGYRVVYGACGSQGGALSGIARIDVSTGETDLHDFGDGHLASEPLFVPRPHSDAEDDGWLLALVYNPGRRAGDAVVLDARAPSAGPLCTAHLPVNTAVTFHGAWRDAR